jgi:hypothetical protein
LGNSKLLAVIDQIIGPKLGQLMLAVGVPEAIIALFCFFNQRQTLAWALVAWSSINVVVYCHCVRVRLPALPRRCAAHAHWVLS